VAKKTAQRGARYNRTSAQAQRLSEEGYVKHSRECEATKEEARAALANKQKKQD
jgi:hypothetical protein